MSKEDFEALFAELTGTSDTKTGKTDKGRGLSPGLAELLRTLGVSVDQAESGLNLMTLTSDSGSSGPLRDEGSSRGVSLVAMLEHMNAEQLKQVAKRFHPDANASRVGGVQKSGAAGAE